ncbi:MAG: molybdenum cofactor biosynthesis protein MoaE [Nannocystaceae bacterium]
MKLSALVFAALRVRLGSDQVDVEVADDATVDDLLRIIGERYPAAADLLSTCRVAIDQRFVDRGARLREGVEVAVIPPVSGGHDGPAPAPDDAPKVAALSFAPLDHAAVVAAVSHRGAGGITTFVGNVRDRSQGRSIAHLEYEAYEAMALRELAAIIAAIEGSIAGAKVAIHHRLGRLEIGDTAVIIAASAAHRAEAFDACRRAIEALKRDVPIWKREVAVDGETWFGRGP